MGSTQKPHVVLVPFPAHGHVAPHTQLARVLHARGIHVTLVHTELHHRRLLRAGKGGGDAATVVSAGFDIEVIPDGLSVEDPPQTLAAHHEAMERNCLEPFKSLLQELMGDRPGVPPVSCVVVDTPMPFAAEAARQVGVPDVQFFTASACGLMGYLQFEELIKKEVIPHKGSGYTTHGYLDTALDWVPGMKGMRLRDMPTFCHTTDADDWLLRFHVHQMRLVASSKAVILNTFREMEKDVLDALAVMLPPVYTVGPIASILAASCDKALGTAFWDASLLPEDTECMAWLDGKPARSVVYVSFGSHATMGDMTLSEFASGLARCGSPYLWVLRPDMATDVEVAEDGLVVPWCAQEAVLSHPAVGLFVSHCGWNSILESVGAGVPVLGCPVVAEQTTNCRQLSLSWDIGVELPQGSRSDEIATLVIEMVAGKKGEDARKKTLEWKTLAEDAAKQGGSSYKNIDRLMDDILLLEGR